VRHWSTGLSDMRETLRHRNWLDKPGEDEPFVTHDLHRGRPAYKDAAAAT
jgi:NTE family protein